MDFILYGMKLPVLSLAASNKEAGRELAIVLSVIIIISNILVLFDGKPENDFLEISYPLIYILQINIFYFI